MILVESDERVLSSFPEDLSASAMKQLKQLGVEVRTGVRAKNLTEAGLEMGDEFIPLPGENLGRGQCGFVCRKDHRRAGR